MSHENRGYLGRIGACGNLANRRVCLLARKVLCVYHFAKKGFVSVLATQGLLICKDGIIKFLW